MKETINKEIIDTAIDYIGQEEIRGNKGFKVEEFQHKMEAVGWEYKQAWCSYFVEAVWKEAYQQWDATLFSRLDKLFSGSAVQTYKNFAKTKDFICNRKFKKGCLVVWQMYKNGKPHWTGHIAIGINYLRKTNEINTIDGNTNNTGSREGYIVASKVRHLRFDVREHGLVCVGFIHPKIV